MLFRSREGSRPLRPGMDTTGGVPEDVGGLRITGSGNTFSTVRATLIYL